ncbi:MAG: hypothetical protein AAF316_00290 [Cyanobacteria bacterium P01_A01_bin.80]
MKNYQTRSIQLYSLNEQILAGAIYLNFSTTKAQLSNLLETSRNTIKRYDKILFYTVEDYKKEYPPLPCKTEEDKQVIRKKRCTRDRERPLSTYQSWVVSLLKTAYFALKSTERVKQFIEQNNYLFSKQSYVQILNKLAA